MTGQPGSAGADRSGRDRDAASDSGRRSSGNWSKAVEDHDTGQARSAGQGRDPGQGRDAGQARSAGQAPEVRRSQPPRTPAVDLTSEFQRWLIRSGARSMRRELGEQFRRAWNGQRDEPTKPADVWDAATTEPPPESSEAPECAWCPVCRAARRIRESGPGLGGQLAGAGDAVAAAVQEAMAAFDAVLSARPRTEPADGSARPAQADPPETPAAGAPSEEPDDEPDDRD